MIRINNIRLSVRGGSLEAAIEKKIGTNAFTDVQIVKKAIDARKKNDIKYVYTVDVCVKDENRILRKSGDISQTREYKYSPPHISEKLRVIIIGSGPAGLFCALELAKGGAHPIVIERGECVDDRKKTIDSFWKTGVLDESSNVQFGEGGAGTFSDGKLTTGIKDDRIREVLNEFVEFGAPDEIKYLSKPHIGTDNLQKIVKSMREKIISLGGEFHFKSLCTDILIKNHKACGVRIKDSGKEYEINADYTVIAAGHSARDTFSMLKACNVKMEQKPFSVGVRIEHRQDTVNLSQYGELRGYLPAADYKLFTHLESGRGVYTFCMCPGGYVINASSENGRAVTNGMSNFMRDGVNANSALLVSVNTEDYGSDDVLAGIEFQRKIEEHAFIAGGGDFAMPICTVGDFMGNTSSGSLGSIVPTVLPKVKIADFDTIFPTFVTSSLREAIPILGKKLKGFYDNDAVMTAPETRSSSPVRIVRDKDTHLTSVDCLFSAGEGGAHAGGITSSAVDGIKTAESILTFGRD